MLASERCEYKIRPYGKLHKYWIPCDQRLSIRDGIDVAKLPPTDSYRGTLNPAKNIKVKTPFDFHLFSADI